MLGYIRPCSEELLVRQDMCYKSVYCGLCKTLGGKICKESRLVLSYDMVFLAFCRYILEEKNPEFTKSRCSVNPFKKKSVAVRDSVLEYCAAMCSLLAWYKLDDDVRDSHGMRKFFSSIIRLFAKRMKRKAGYEDISEKIKEYLDTLSLLEKKDTFSPDELAECFGHVTETVFSYGLEEDKKRIAEEIGFHIGKWIYFADAADDLGKDRKIGAFNPFKNYYSKESCQTAMLHELQSASLALDLASADESDCKAIAENIIRLGMPRRAEQILERGNK